VYKPKGVEESVGEIIRVTVKDALDSFAGLSELALVNPDYMEKVRGACSGQTKVIIELMRKFERFYSEVKLKANCLDFADLERYALKLLTRKGEDGGLAPTETAVGLRERYKYIFVDEYQDINGVQQAILDSLKGEDNVFVVGDVKQSIYGFRGTDPGIFARQLKTASPDAGEAKNGFRVDLNLSFRSRKGILDFVNRVFGRIMRSSVASIDYDESAELKRGLEAESEGKAGPAVEFVIVDSEEKAVVGERGYSIRECEAAAAAKRIREMVGADGGKTEFKIFDKELGKERAVDYRDIVILMRSPSKRVNDYIRILRLVGVPVSCSVSGGYFESTEICDCVSLLKVLDNPRRDIELAAVLRSPFFGVTDSELAKVKIGDGEGKDFYDCVVEYSKSGKEAKLSEKLCAVLGQLEKWRDVGRSGEIADLIWQVYRKTGYLSYVTALANGQQRRANLLKLHERAIQFEGFVSGGGQPSLRRFIEFLEKLEEAGQDWSGAEPEASVGNAVRIMSIHRSKGLEFPVVFLAELNSPFSSKDFASDCVADAGYAVGLRIIDRATNTKLDSIAYQLIEREKREKFLAEEMRILYVGMTRARERVVLSGSASAEFCRKVISKGYFGGDGPIADWELRSCKRGLGWVLLGLSCERELHEGFGTDLAVERDGLFRLGYYSEAELVDLCDYLDGFKSKTMKGRLKAPKKGKVASERFLRLKESLGWHYGYSGSVGMRAKDSVTGITHRDDEFAKFDYTA
jgi:ATP-dependent helicase/nuclease subunit A